MRTKVYKVPMNSPEDTSGIANLIQEGLFRAEDVIGILGKTEGNGCVNDFSRGYATLAMKQLFSTLLGASLDEIGRRISIIQSGGTEGVLSPHCNIFVREEAGSGDGKNLRMAIASIHTRDFLPEELGRTAQVLETARAVREGMKQAKITGPQDVHFVQIKCPLLTAQRIGEAQKRGQSVVTHDTYEFDGVLAGSIGAGRGAGAGGDGRREGERRDHLPRMEPLLRGGINVSRDRGAEQRDHHHGQQHGVGRRPCDRPFGDEGCP